ncbi:hypothetical protein BDB00DRAFT_372240 [Zychaea mexicana]|uniref:uncharacterized protein n=1 Tax=Zychaea mexicana TaxID=64656 RepID=UPI0022FEF75C|nr:uncharacterized protein BDB00DRAFT_372240 [Zychaea mexicana]KAI9493451.1 hypothetical protein BDB00DRAFT_372240 [Zychaea mexicana]
MLELLYKSPLQIWLKNGPQPPTRTKKTLPTKTTTMRNYDLGAENPMVPTPIPDDDDFQQQIEEAVDEIEACAKKISELGNSYIAKMNNSFILLTVLGFVPAAMACLEYLVEPYYGFVICLTLLAASTFYTLYYIIQYWVIPEVLRYLLRRLVKSKDELFSTFDQETSEKYKSQVIEETAKTAQEARLTFASLCKRRGVVDGACQIIMGLLSFALVLLLLIGEKTEEWGMPAMAELTFAVWMFFANVILAIVYAFISTRKHRKKWRETEAVAREVARKEAAVQLMA